MKEECLFRVDARPGDPDGTEGVIFQVASVVRRTSLAGESAGAPVLKPGRWFEFLGGWMC